MHLTVHNVGLIVLATVVLPSMSCTLVYTMRLLTLQMRLAWRKPLGPSTSSDVSEEERARIGELEARQRKYGRRLMISFAVATVTSWAATAWRK